MEILGDVKFTNVSIANANLVKGNLAGANL
jgi:uncharacterized protein YjbI with pentapeptide repeats